MRKLLIINKRALKKKRIKINKKNKYNGIIIILIYSLFKSKKYIENWNPPIHKIKKSIMRQKSLLKTHNKNLYCLQILLVKKSKKKR